MMLLTLLILIPIIGILIIYSQNIYSSNTSSLIIENRIKNFAFIASIIDLFLSLVIFILYDSSTIQFQFVIEYNTINYYNLYLGVDGLSIYFVLLTTIIMPIALLSN